MSSAFVVAILTEQIPFILKRYRYTPFIKQSSIYLCVLAHFKRLRLFCFGKMVRARRVVQCLITRTRNKGTQHPNEDFEEAAEYVSVIGLRKEAQYRTYQMYRF